MVKGFLMDAETHHRAAESIPWGHDTSAIDTFAHTIFKSTESLRPDRCGEFLDLIHELAEAEYLLPRETEVLNRLYLPKATYAQAGEAVFRDGGYAIQVHDKAVALMAAAMHERAEWAETNTRDYWLVTGG